MIALALFLFTLILHWWAKRLRKLLICNPKTHLRGFILSLCFLIHLKAITKWPKWLETIVDLTTTSSIWTSINWPIILWNIKFIALWYVAPTFFRLKGITTHSYRSSTILNIWRLFCWHHLQWYKFGYSLSIHL